MFKSCIEVYRKFYLRGKALAAQLFQHFFQGASAKGAKSTALHSLQWVIGLILAGLPVVVWAGGPSWLLIVLAVFLGVTFLTFVGSYLFLLFADRDALRSESFSLSKMAMEKGLIGDDVSGLVEKSPDSLLIGATSAKGSKGRQNG